MDGSAHARPSTQPPIDTRRKILGACVCKDGLKQLPPQTPQKSYIKFQNSGTTFENPPLCLTKCSIVRVLGVSSKCFWEWNPNIFFNKEPMQNLGTLR